MSKEALTPKRVTREYDEGVQFNSSEQVNLYNKVDANESFFIGDQWRGVQANGLPTPVFNFLKRVVLFSVANVSTDNLKLHATPLPSSGKRNSQAIETLTDILNDQFASIFEFNKMGSLIREFARNAAVDGDGCTYTYWDPSVDTGQAAKGAIKTEVLQNTQVLFGNPNSRDVQSQPYILVERRMMVDDARDRAEENDVPQDDMDLIESDEKNTSTENGLDRLGGHKVTVLTRLWRDKKTRTIHGYECTKEVTIRDEWDLGIKLYPITWMNWDYVQESYHGQAMITGLIPNQIFVNKLFAMSMISLMTLAYPKIVYDHTKLAHWNNRVGAAIPVNGNVDNVAKIIDPAQISPQISQFIETAVSYTQKFLGATDVALGDTRPDNTSAIIALQRAASTPMELTKQNLLQSIEDQGRIYTEFMGEYYGTRYVEIKNPYDSEKLVIAFDFSVLKTLPFTINLDVGASSYWSEIASMQTLDNLLMQGKIDTVDYLERIPAGQITDKETLIAVMKQRQMQQAQMMGIGGAPDNGGTPANPGGEVAENSGAGSPLPAGAGYSQLQRKINQTGAVPSKM